MPITSGEPNAQHREYRIQLASRTLPQRIEVVFRGRLKSRQWSETQPWDAPRLGELPVGKTLWRVCGPRQFAPTHAATPAERLAHELIRLQNTADIIEQGIALPNRKSDDLLNWYRPWARRCAAMQHEVRRALSTVNRPQLLRSAEDLLQRIGNRQIEIAKELQAGDILNLRQEGPPLTADVNSLWSTTLGSSRPSALYAEDAVENADSGHGDLSFVPRRASDIWTRLYAVFAVAAVSILVRQGIRGGLLSMLARRWPHLLGVAAGLVWWLFLNPSPLGLVIVAVCLIASVRAGWQDHPRNDSIIVPLN